MDTWTHHPETQETFLTSNDPITWAEVEGAFENWFDQNHPAAEITNIIGADAPSEYCATYTIPESAYQERC